MQISNFFECEQNKQQGYADFSEHDFAPATNLLNKNYAMPRTKSDAQIIANDN